MSAREISSANRCCLFFFNDTATTEIYTLSLHDALPIWRRRDHGGLVHGGARVAGRQARSEEHTSELQSLRHLVCRLLLEKKNTQSQSTTTRLSAITYTYWRDVLEAT